jgi:outer membrane protein assembly factor BamB
MINKKLTTQIFFLLSAICIVIIVKVYLTYSYSDQWEQITINAPTDIGLTFHEDYLFTGNSKGLVEKINKKNGKTIWSTDLQASIQQRILVTSICAIVTTKHGNIYCLSNHDGNQIWHYTTPDMTNLAEPMIIKNQLITRSSGGTIFSINIKTGKTIWTYDSKTTESLSQILSSTGLNWFGDITTYRNNLLYASPDGNIYALNIQNGKLLWQISTQSRTMNQLLLYRDTLYVGTDQGLLLSINPNSGKIIKSTYLSNTPITCIMPKPKKFYQLFNPPPLLITSLNGNVYTLEPKSSTTQDNFSLQTQISSCPTVDASNIYVINNSHSLYSYKLSNGNLNWTYETEGKPTFSPIIVNRLTTIVNLPLLNYIDRANVVLFGDDQGHLHAIRSSNGSDLWTLNLPEAITILPNIVHNVIYISSQNGSIYSYGFSNLKSATKQSSIEVTSISRLIGNNQLFEFSIPFEQHSYIDPWNQVTVTAKFTHAVTGKQIIVAGFYYDDDVWKVRFMPPSTGKWLWQISLILPNKTNSAKGEINSQTDTNQTYIRLDPNNPSQLTIDGIHRANLFGIQNQIDDFNWSGTALDDFSIGTKDTLGFTATISGTTPVYFSSDKLIDLNSYLNTYGESGQVFNLYRFGVDNASFSLYNGITTSSKPLTNEGRVLDKLFETARNSSYHIWFSLFSFQIPYAYDGARSVDVNSLKQYVQYLVARYGAYVDIWEIANEAIVPDNTAVMLANLIRSLDYESRPITTNWPKAKMDEIDIVSLHDYRSDNYRQSDKFIYSDVENSLQYNKPVIFSELGNKLLSHENHSDEKMRIQSWTAQMNNASIIFWNQPDNPNYYNSTLDNANIYLGDQERQYTKILNQFTRQIPLSAKSTTISTNKKYIRNYALTYNEGTQGYFVCEIPTSTFNIYLDPKRNGIIAWMDPATGKIIKQERIHPAIKTYSSPSCTVDLAIKLTY